jgi:hypothetical protein
VKKMSEYMDNNQDSFDADITKSAGRKVADAAEDCKKRLKRVWFS